MSYRTYRPLQYVSQGRHHPIHSQGCWLFSGTQSCDRPQHCFCSCVTIMLGICCAPMSLRNTHTHTRSLSLSCGRTHNTCSWHEHGPSASMCVCVCVCVYAQGLHQCKAHQRHHCRVPVGGRSLVTIHYAVQRSCEAILLSVLLLQVQVSTLARIGVARSHRRRRHKGPHNHASGTVIM